MNYTNLSEYAPGSGCVLVTGGTGSLGKALVEILRQQGARVAFQYNQPGPAADALETEGVRGYQADLSDPEAVGRLYGRVVADFGTVESLVHCASPAIPLTPVDRTGAAAFRELSAIQVEAFFHIVGLLLPQMKLRQQGTIISVLSEAVLPGGIPGWSAYGAVKAALMNLTATLAEEAGPCGIRSIGVLPGAFRAAPRGTPEKSLLQARSQKALSARWPLGIAPQTVAELIKDILFGTKYANGTMIAVNAHEGVRTLAASSSGRGNEEESASKAQPASAPTAPDQQSDDNSEVAEKLTTIFRRVFRLKDDAAVSDAKLGVWRQWDSLNHLNLLMTIEHEFDISLGDMEGNLLTSYSSVLKAVSKKVHTDGA